MHFRNKNDSQEALDRLSGREETLIQWNLAGKRPLDSCRIAVRTRVTSGRVLLVQKTRFAPYVNPGRALSL
jgi:hypothetical protein